MLARLTLVIVTLFAIVGIILVTAQCPQDYIATCCLTPPDGVRSILCLWLILMNVIRPDTVMGVSMPTMEYVTPHTCIAAMLP